MASVFLVTSLLVDSKLDYWGNKQTKIEHLTYSKYLLILCLQQISLNSVPCFAIKWLKYTNKKWIFSIQVIGKCIFAIFEDFSLFPGEKISNLWLFLFGLGKQLRYAAYGLKLVAHIKHTISIKHTYISMVKKSISTYWVVRSFFFFFCLVGHNLEFLVIVIIRIIVIMIIIIIINLYIRNYAYIPILSISPTGSRRAHISSYLRKKIGENR